MDPTPAESPIGRQSAKTANARRAPVEGAAAAVAPGWPRRRSRCMADVETEGVHGASARA
jgi:hypothetical protein